jgi:DNA (cytosine-5)-methyltransferase 1
MTYSLIDLYSGIGGLGLGALRAGFSLALSVDIDPILSEVHAVNFPGYPHLLADVSTLTGPELLSKANVGAGELTGLVGGSPCQGFSRIGKRDQLDNRNRLFIHFFRLVSETRPAFFLAENVQGILDPQNKELVDSALDLVRASYVLIEPFEINAADFGAATIRKRVFFIGYLRDKCERLEVKDFERRKQKNNLTVETALSGLPQKLKNSWLSDENGWRTLRVKPRGGFWSKIHADVPVGVGDPETVEALRKQKLVSSCIATLHTAAVEKRFANVAQGETDSISRMPRLKRDGLCPTLRAGTGSDKGSFQALRPIHFSENRVITPREAARLQGFPDWFRFHPTKWHSFRGIGNSVSPFVAEALFKVILSKLKTK